MPTFDSASVVVVDLQEKLLAVMPQATALVRDVRFLLEVAHATAMPIVATEQYPQGLGPTVPTIRTLLNTQPIAKTRFSAIDAIPAGETFIVCGIEAHVCVQATCLDLRAAGKTVVVPVDGVCSRHETDARVALERLRQAGVILTTVEAIAFERLGDASHPAFKAVSKLVRARDAERLQES